MFKSNRNAAACVLCGLPVGYTGLRESRKGEILSFCCLGCRQVYEILANLPEGRPKDFKATDLYRFCKASGLIGQNSVEKIKNRDADPDAFPDDRQPQELEDDLTLELVLRVEGMWCGACSWLLEAVLGRLEGVSRVTALFASDLVRISYFPHQVSGEEIQAQIARLGYRPVPVEESAKITEERKKVQLRLGISTILTVHVMMISLALYAGFFQDLEPEAVAYLSYPLWLLATPVLFYGGLPILGRAWSGLRYGHPALEVLIAIGALAAYGYSLLELFRGGRHLYFDTAAMLIVLVLLGKYLEGRTKEKISRGLTQLYHLASQKVRLCAREGERWQSAERIRPGDEFQARAGDRVPVDGRILDGLAELEESSLTGESRPIRKGAGEEVRAGSRLLHGTLTIRATRVGAESSVGRIIALMQEGLSRKTTVELVADRLTRWIVPALLALAVGTAWFLFAQGHTVEESLLRAVTILVIACPCALGIATPLAKVAAMGVGRERGILIRNPAALEKIRKLDVLLFDKTGTLTEGRYGLREMICLEGQREEAFQKIASVEACSEHFLAREILSRTPELPSGLLEVENFQALAGRGVKGIAGGTEVVVGNRGLMEDQGLYFPPDLDAQTRSREVRGLTVVFFGWEGRVHGFLSFGDRLKETALPALARLRPKGFKIRLVSGDSEETTGAIAREAGLESFSGRARPEDKVRFIRELQQQGHRVGMIGDGVNDAAALAQADVGLALGGRAGIMTAAADITLLGDDPAKVGEALDLANRTYGIMRQNLLFAFFYNILGIPLAMTGRLNPLIAALAMMASSLTVMGNTLRIFRTGLAAVPKGKGAFPAADPHTGRGESWRVAPGRPRALIVPEAGSAGELLDSRGGRIEVPHP